MLVGLRRLCMVWSRVVPRPKPVVFVVMQSDLGLGAEQRESCGVWSGEGGNNTADMWAVARGCAEGKARDGFKGTAFGVECWEHSQGRC